MFIGARRTGPFLLSLSLHAGVVAILLYVLTEARQARRTPTASIARFEVLPSSESVQSTPSAPSDRPEANPAMQEPARKVDEAPDATRADNADLRQPGAEQAIVGEADGRAVTAATPAVSFDRAPASSDAPAAAPQVRRAVDQAPVVGLQPIASDAIAQTWEGMLLARLNQRKRYPVPARAAGQEGTAHVRLVIDRRGRLVDATLWKSAGHPLLDREALALGRRASPFPPPPEALPGAQIVRIVPIDFYIRTLRTG